MNHAVRTTDRTTRCCGSWTGRPARVGAVLCASLLVGPPAALLVGAPARADGGDPAPPQVTWTYRDPDSNGWWTHEVSVGLEVHGDAGIDVEASRVLVTDPYLQVTGQDVPRAGIELTVADQGPTVISYDVVDELGRHASGEAEIYLDSIAPIVVPTGLPADGATLVQGSASGPGLSCDDGGDFATSSGLAPGGCLFTAGITGGRLDTSTPGPLTVTAEARDVAGNLTSVTRHYTVVAPRGGPRNLERPTVSGDRSVDGGLVADPGRWTGTPRSFAFQWLRDGAPIDGATTAAYQVAPDDLGHRVKVRVTAIADGGQRSAASSAARIER